MKILFLIVFIGSLISFSSSSFAQLRKDMEFIKGPIVEMNREEETITVFHVKAGANRTFRADENILKKFSIDQFVVVIAKGGSDIVTNIKPVKR